MKDMTRRERLERCYFNRDVDRPAVYSRDGFPPGDSSYDRLKGYLQAHSELKTGWPATQFTQTPPLETSTEAYSAAFERRVEMLHTPKGDLRRSFLVSLQGEPGLHETFFIGSRDDAERYLSLPVPEIGGDVSSFFVADAEAGDRGIVEVHLGFNPGGFVAELCGSENFAVLSMTDRDILHALCERHMQIILRLLTFLLDRKAGPFFAMLGQEYIVPPLHGPQDFYDFNVKYDKPIIDLIHNAGGRVHIHCHGSIKNVLQGFVDMGTDVLHPFEPPPQGDILPREAKRMARGKMCLEGNIQINQMYEAEPNDIRQQTEALIADVFDDHRGLIVSPTASPYIRGKGEACFPQYKAMIDTVTGFEE